MKLTAQTVMALMMPSLFLARCFFHQPPPLYIVQTLAEVGVGAPPTFVSKSARWAARLIATQLPHMLPF